MFCFSLSLSLSIYLSMRKLRKIILEDYFLLSIYLSIYLSILFLLLSEFFTIALADGFSLEFEWQEVSSSLQDSSQDSVRTQLCSSLDGLHSSSYF